LEELQMIFRKASGMHVIRDIASDIVNHGADEDAILAMLTANPREQLDGISEYLGDDATYATIFLTVELPLLAAPPASITALGNDDGWKISYFWFLLIASFCHAACALIAVVWAATAHRLARDSDVLKTLIVCDKIIVMANTFWTLGIIFLYTGLYPAFVQNFGLTNGTAGYVIVSIALLLVWRQCDLVKHERNVRTYWRDQRGLKKAGREDEDLLSTKEALHSGKAEHVTEHLKRKDPYDITLGMHRINVLAELAMVMASRDVDGKGV
jgi:hypothetical protein